MYIKKYYSVENRKLKKRAEIRLWGFAGQINITNANYTKKLLNAIVLELAFLLKLFACFDHPVAKLVITRLLPLIIIGQNSDGS